MVRRDTEEITETNAADHDGIGEMVFAPRFADLETEREVGVGNARVDDRVLARGGGVQLAAECVEDLGDLERVVRGSALEQQVLDEVADAGLARRLVARAAADPPADGNGAHAGEPLRGDAKAAGQLGDLVLGHGWGS